MSFKTLKEMMINCNKKECDYYSEAYFGNCSASGFFCKNRNKS